MTSALEHQVLAAARDLGRKIRSYRKAYDAIETVRGLDEFDPKHCAWETRLFNCEKRVEAAKEKLKKLSLRLSYTHPFQGLGQ